LEEEEVMMNTKIHKKEGKLKIVITKYQAKARHLVVAQSP